MASYAAHRREFARCCSHSPPSIAGSSMRFPGSTRSGFAYMPMSDLSYDPSEGDISFSVVAGFGHANNTLTIVAGSHLHRP